MKYLLLIIILMLSGCGQKEYYESMKAVNTAQIAAWERQQDKRRVANDMNMAADQSFTAVIFSHLQAAAKTTTFIDDMTVSNMYNQYQMSKLVQAFLYNSNNDLAPTPPIYMPEAPDSIVDGMKAIAPWISVLAPWFFASEMVGDAIGQAGDFSSISVGGDMASSSPDSFNNFSGNTITVPYAPVP